MRYVLFLSFVVAAMGCRDLSKPKKGYDYCYASGRGLYIGRYGHDPIRVFVNGTDARLSPDGASIAYTDMGAADHQRRIAILDLEAGKVTLLDTGCHNCYAPVWSPDGSYLAYNALNDNERGIKYIDREGQHPVLLAISDDSATDFFSPTWSVDGNRIAVQNMSGVYIYDLEGRVDRSISFQAIDTAITFSSESNFVLAGNGDKLVFWGSEGPAAVFVYDMAASRTSRISPKGYDCWRPVIKGDTIFCRGRHGSSLKENTYRMDMDGSHFKLAYKDRVDISFAQR